MLEFLNFDVNKFKSVVINVRLSNESEKDASCSIDEIKQLAFTLGVGVDKTFSQKKDKVDPAYFMGKGKLEEIKNYVAENGINLILIDNSISGIQERNLEEFFKLPILDRTMIILYIFKKRARSNEAKLQVDLASMEYMLPRLKNMWTHFSRSEGVVGIRGGEGEKQLELDKRIVKDRIKSIKDKLKEIDVQMQSRRKKRLDSREKIVSLVGYTNAGKTTLMNLLSKSNMQAENLMFSTIGSSIRKVYINDSLTILLNDTVGFINKLPHNLVASFKSTLDEILSSHLILHVIDSSSDYMSTQINSVEQVLREIGVENIPMIRVFNKMDMLDYSPAKLNIQHKSSDCYISALNKNGIDKLKSDIAEHFSDN